MSALIPILLSMGLFDKPEDPFYYAKETIHLNYYGEWVGGGGDEPYVPDTGATHADLQRAYWSYSTTDATPPRHRVYFKPATVEKYWRAIVDVTGDGRKDRVFRDPEDGILKLGQNFGSNSAPLYAEAVDLFGEGNFPMSEVGGGKLPFKMRFTADVIGAKGIVKASVDYVRLQDINGDGRPDILDARNPGKWIAYLNTPSSSGNPIYWAKTEIPVDHLVDEWRSRVSEGANPSGHRSDFANGWISGARFPLAWILSSERGRAEARGYEFWGWNVQNGCTGVSSLAPLEMARTSCAWARSHSRDIIWPLDQLAGSDLVFDVVDANGDGYVDLVSRDWPYGFRAFRETPTNLEIPVVDPECRQGVCEPGLFRAPAEKPSVHHNGLPNLVVLPKPESIYPDLPAELQVVRNNYDKFAACYADGDVFCNPNPPFTITTYADCYSWYGGLRWDLNPSSDPKNCLVEDISTRWQGHILKLGRLPGDTLNFISDIAGLGQ